MKSGPPQSWMDLIVVEIAIYELLSSSENLSRFKGQRQLEITHVSVAGCLRY